MPRKLPPLNAIRAFDASARRGGFVAAAAELGVTAAAVSLQIRKLEAFYEVELFRRLPSGVELTDLGAAIHAECMAALATLEGTRDIVAAREARSRIVVSCINSVAHRWLAERLARFARGGELWVELRAEADPIDFEEGGADIRITYGLHLYPQHHAAPLFTDVLMPLCTPELAARLDPEDPNSLPDEWLIETWWSPSFWAYPSWSDWFAQAGAPRAARSGVGPAANMPALAIDFALSGMGVALAQHSLALRELREGRLVRPFRPVLPLASSYAVVTPRSARRRRRTAPVVDWLMAEARELDALRSACLEA